MTPHQSDLKKVLDLQAYVDGEVSAEGRRRVEALLLGDPEAQELARSLSGIRELMRSGEPEARLTDSLDGEVVVRFRRFGCGGFRRLLGGLRHRRRRRRDDR